jgi:hypothetical protein
MSRLIDKLAGLKKNEPRPFGFALGKTAPEKPRMQLIASLTPDNFDKVADNLGPADGVIVRVAKPEDVEAIRKICSIPDGPPAGGFLQSSDPETLKKITDTTCDFAVLPPDAPLVSIQGDKMGRILELDLSLSEGMLRTANDLPVDAILVTGQVEAGSLTFSQLMSIQRLAYLVNKPILVEISSDLTEAELQALWDTGISGAVVKVTSKKSTEKLADLNKILSNLIPPALHKKSRLSAILPQIRQEEPPAKHEEEEEEDE